MSQTDWARLDAMSDRDIDISDIPPLSADFWAKAQLRIPSKYFIVQGERLTVPLDE